MKISHRHMPPPPLQPLYVISQVPVTSWPGLVNYRDPGLARITQGSLRPGKIIGTYLMRGHPVLVFALTRKWLTYIQYIDPEISEYF